MRKIEKRIILFVALICILFLEACFGKKPELTLIETSVTNQAVINGEYSHNKAEEVVQGQAGRFPSSYNDEIGNCRFIIDEIDSPESIVLHSGTAANINADYLGLAQELLKGEKYTVDNETGDVYVIEKSNDDFVIYKYYATTKGTIDFVDYSIPYSQSVRLDYQDPYFNLSKFTNKKEFSFGTAEECFDDVASLFAKYGLDIKNDVIVETYYLDHEVLAKEELAFDKVGNIDDSRKRTGGWSKQDDAYMFLINQQCQELPVSFHSSFLWAGWYSSLSNAGIVVICNENGIALIESRRQICTYKFNDDFVKLLPFDAVASGVAEHLNGFVDGSSSYTITKAKLYVAHEYSRNFGEVALEFHWAFWVTESRNGKTKSYELNFNASTGEYEEY